MAKKRVYFNMQCDVCQHQRDAAPLGDDEFEEVAGDTLVGAVRDSITLSQGHESCIVLSVKEARLVRTALGRAIKSTTVQ